MSLLKDDETESARDGNKSFRSRRRWFIALIVLALLLGGGYFLHRQGVDLPRAFATAKTSSEDAITTAGVKTALALSQRVSAFAIDVETTDSVVRLTGDVPSEEVRELAVAISRDTAGVKEVEDYLRVDPGARPSPELERLKKRVADLEIQTVLNNTLSRNPDLVGKDIRVTVDDRRVVLEGSVEDWDERGGAEHIAAGIEGVREIVNRIEVTAPDGDDAETPEETVRSLTKQARFALFASDAFDVERIQVSAINGVLTLRGEVRSQAEKLLAERIVREIEGVDSVANELTVLFAPHRAEAPARPYAPLARPRDSRGGT